jgi:hypothetical protein
MAVWSTQSLNRNEHQESTSGGIKGGRRVGLAICELIMAGNVTPV